MGEEMLWPSASWRAGLVSDGFFSPGVDHSGQLRTLLGDEESRFAKRNQHKGFRRSSQVCELLLRSGYGKSSSSPSRAKEMDRLGALKRLPRATRSGAAGGLYGDISGEDVKIH
jgi:hypothetical protein